MEMEMTEYQKRLEALEFAFKSKALEPELDLIQEAQNIFEWLNPEADKEDVE